jgi:dihydrofolate reductase
VTQATRIKHGARHASYRREMTSGETTRVQYFTACTLDGFIADEHDSLDWLFEVPHTEDDGSWDEFIGGVGPLVMGATTYQWVLDHENLMENPDRWREFYDDRPLWLFTHRDLPLIPGVDITVVSGPVRPVYDELVTAADGRNIWIVGGGDLVGQFDDAGLLDEISLGMTPVTLGAGRPLLPRRITSERLSFREAKQTGQRVRIILDVQRRRDGAG